MTTAFDQPFTGAPEGGWAPLLAESGPVMAPTVPVQTSGPVPPANSQPLDPEDVLKEFEQIRPRGCGVCLAGPQIQQVVELLSSKHPKEPTRIVRFVNQRFGTDLKVHHVRWHAEHGRRG